MALGLRPKVHGHPDRPPGHQSGMAENLRLSDSKPARWAAGWVERAGLESLRRRRAAKGKISPEAGSIPDMAER